MKLRTIALALALLVPASAQAVTIIIDGDTINFDGVGIRIVQIDTPATFGPRCENELILGIKAKKRLRELLDGDAVTYQATRHDRYGRTLARGVRRQGRRRRDADRRREPFTIAHERRRSNRSPSLKSPNSWPGFSTPDASRTTRLPRHAVVPDGPQNTTRDESADHRSSSPSAR